MTVPDPTSNPTPNPEPNKVEENPPSNVPNLPEPPPSNASEKTVAAYFEALSTAINGMPEKIALAIRESTPAPTPSAPASDAPKADPPKDDASGNPPIDEKPGKNKARVTFFGIPWE